MVRCRLSLLLFFFFLLLLFFLHSLLPFLDASSHPYKRVLRPSVRPSVVLLVTPLSSMPEIANFKCRNYLDSKELMENIISILKKTAQGQ